MTTTIQRRHRFMHPSGEKITLGCYFPSSSSTDTTTTSATTADTNSTTPYYNSNLPLTLFSISIDSTSLLRSTPSPEGAEDLSNFDIDSTTSTLPSHVDYRFKSTPFRKRRRLQDLFDQLETKDLKIAGKQGEIFKTLGSEASSSLLLISSCGSEEQKDPRILKGTFSKEETVQRSSCSSHVNSRGDLKTFSTFIKEEYQNIYSGSDAATQRLECMPCGQSIMNEGEQKDFWNREKVNNDEPRSGSVPGDELRSGSNRGSGSSSSAGSLHASVSSDTSDDSLASGNHQGTHQIENINFTTDQQQQQQKSCPSPGGEVSAIANPGGSGGGDLSSTFLFIGPVGKKRKYCRERQKSGDTEQESRSPFSLPPPTPTSGEFPDDRDPASMEQDPYSPDPAEENAAVGGGGQGQRQCSSVPSSSHSSSPLPSRNILRSSNGGGREEQSQSVGVITSTPTPVIRSLSSHRRREEQPLNLSLPSPSEPQQHFSNSNSVVVRSPSSGRGRGESSSVHVSVISLAAPSREREDELSNDVTSFQDISSPSLSLYSNRSPRESSGDLTPGTTSSRLSPPVPSTPSTSTRDFHQISPGEALPSPVTPSTFQGLLAAHGIGVVSPGSGGGTSSAQKKKLQCRDCGKEFSQLRNYRYHRSRHEGTQQFACTCPVCGKTFNDKGYLSSHLKIHRNAKEYKCQYCEKSFNQRVAYNMHVRIHTGHKPHKCPVCPKAFSRKMLLRQHLRTHTGERPYKCEICGKAFADRSNMLLHQRLHSGQRPYKCEQCGKSFSKNHHLKTHLNHHAGIKPYQCEKCKACFSQSSNMKTHYRKCSGIPSVTSTVTSGTFETSNTESRPSSSLGGSSISTIHNTLSSPLQRYSITEEAREEQQLHQQQQLLLQAQQEHLHQQLSLSQQQQLLREASQFNLRGNQQASGLLLHSPSHSSRSGVHRSSSTLSLSQTSSSQSLGLNMGVLGMASPPMGGRSRRTGSGGVSLIPMGSPSPTSLAAGHPFIPLAAVESLGAASNPSSSSPMHPANPSLLSPRNHYSSLNDLNSAASAFSHMRFSQSSHQQRVLSRSRLTLQQQQYLSQQQQMHSDVISESRVHHQIPSSPQHQQHRMSTPRASPQRHLISPRSTQSPDNHYEIVLPALAVSRVSPHTGQQQFQIQHESFAQQSRPHGTESHNIHHQQHQHHISRLGINGNSNSSSIHHHSNLGSLLSVSRASSTGVQSVMSSEEGYIDSPTLYSEQDDSPHPPSSLWRNRDNDDVKFNIKGGQFGNSNLYKGN